VGENKVWFQDADSATAGCALGGVGKQGWRLIGRGRVSKKNMRGVHEDVTGGVTNTLIHAVKPSRSCGTVCTSRYLRCVPHQQVYAHRT
jgi:hypothetical protein